MILIIVAILSIMVALIRKGRFSNIGSAGLRAWFLILLSILMFMGIFVGDYLGVEIVQNYAFIFLMAAYALLIMGLLFNLNIWMFIILLGALLNFVVIFINGGKMPLSSEMVSIAGMSVQAIKASAIQEIASSSTHLPILGGIIPIPLPSILAQVISPGTAVIGLGLFFELQNLLTGVSFDYGDDDEDDEEDEEDGRNAKRSDKTHSGDEDEVKDTGGNDGDEDLSLGKDYTSGDINIHEQTGKLPISDSMAENNSAEAESAVNDAENGQNDESEAEFENTAAFFDTLDPFSTQEDKPEEPASDAFDELNKTFDDKQDVEEDEQTGNEAFENALGSFQEPLSDSYSEPEDLYVTQEPQEEEAEYAESAVASPEDIYDRYTAEDLTLKKDALIEAKAVIENDLSSKKGDNSTVSDKQVPVEVDTDSPFIIVNGRIVENPYYKFRRGGREEDAASSGPIGNGVYFIKSRNPSIAGRPNFAPPQGAPAEKSSPKELTVADDKLKANSDDPNGYERVEMQIGDVQIKFWKKENNE